MESDSYMVFAQPGTSNEQVGGDWPDGWIVMVTRKPYENFIASESGSWIDPMPSSVSRFQGREAMHRTTHGDGSLFEAAETVLADPATPAMYRRAWDDLQEFRRDSEMLAVISGMLGLTAAQVDALFILAASIRA